MKSLDKYPEFEKLVMEIVEEVCEKINNKAINIKSKMPYKTQFTLEEVIKKLEERV